MSSDTIPQPVSATDRVSDVLARDEALVDVFVRHSGHFSKLRSRALRKIMGRLVTVQDAARMAAVPLDTLLRDLNAALGILSPSDDQPAGTSASTRGSRSADAPAGTRNVESSAASPLRHPAGAPTVEVDVRGDLRQGREPLARIMAAVSAVRDGEVLLVRAIFEPVPLFTLLAKRGFTHESARNGSDDWSIWFWRDVVRGKSTVPGPRPASSSTAASEPITDVHGANTICLDVRGLEPPEPLLRTLAALEALPAGHRLVQVNSRVPQLLLPMLAERGFACELDETHAEQVRLRIWRPA